MFVSFIFFFKQKTAYERLISDWSSDVYSSDLLDTSATVAVGVVYTITPQSGTARITPWLDQSGNGRAFTATGTGRPSLQQIGRASCREKVCQVRFALGGRRINKTKTQDVNH